MGWADRISSGIQDAFEEILNTLILDPLSALFEIFLQMAIDLFTKTPYPGKHQDGAPIFYTPSSGGRDCRGLSSTAQQSCEMWSHMYHNVLMEDVMAISIALILLAIGTMYLMRSFGDVFIQDYANLQNMETRFIYAIVGVALWWHVGSLLLYFTEALGRALAGCGPGTCELAMDTGAAGAGAGVFAAVFIYLIGNALLAAVVIFWVLRYVLLILLMGVMPVLIALWAFQVGPLRQLSDLSASIMNLFVLLAFATIPAGLIFRLGDVLGAVAAGLPGGAIAEVLLLAALPVAAGTAPLIMFKESDAISDLSRQTFGGAAAGALKTATDPDSLEEKYEEHEEKVTTAKREARAGAASIRSGEYHTYNEEGELVQAQGASESSMMSRIGRGGRSVSERTASTASGAAKTTAVVGADAMYNREELNDALQEKAKQKKSAVGDTLSGAASSASSRAQSAPGRALDPALQAYTGASGALNTVSSEIEDIKETAKDSDRQDVFDQYLDEDFQSEHDDPLDAFRARSVDKNVVSVAGATGESSSSAHVPPQYADHASGEDLAESWESVTTHEQPGEQVVIRDEGLDGVDGDLWDAFDQNMEMSDDDNKFEVTVEHDGPGDAQVENAAKMVAALQNTNLDELDESSDTALSVSDGAAQLERMEDLDDNLSEITDDVDDVTLDDFDKEAMASIDEESAQTLADSVGGGDEMAYALAALGEEARKNPDFGE